MSLSHWAWVWAWLSLTEPECLSRAWAWQQASLKLLKMKRHLSTLPLVVYWLLLKYVCSTLWWIKVLEGKVLSIIHIWKRPNFFSKKNLSLDILTLWLFVCAQCTCSCNVCTQSSLDNSGWASSGQTYISVNTQYEYQLRNHSRFNKNRNVELQAPGFIVVNWKDLKICLAKKCNRATSFH